MILDYTSKGSLIPVMLPFAAVLGMNVLLFPGMGCVDNDSAQYVGMFGNWDALRYSSLYYFDSTTHHFQWCDRPCTTMVHQCDQHPSTTAPRTSATMMMRIVHLHDDDQHHHQEIGEEMIFLDIHYKHISG